MQRFIGHIAICLCLTGCSSIKQWTTSLKSVRSLSDSKIVEQLEEPQRTTDDQSKTSQPVLLTTYVESTTGEEKAGGESTAPVDADQPTDVLVPPEVAFEQEVVSSQIPESEVFATSPLSIHQVIESVYQSYPELESALYQRNISQGEYLSATGAYDLKLKGSSENGPVGFYQTYRQSIGIVQPTYGGGEIFSGYRIGRGDYEPWYRERETNGGGEFKIGASVPLAQNRTIDQRRSDLWKSDLEMQLVEPDIQAQLIGFIQEASYAYWNWVAAGQNHVVAKRVLELAEDRTERIRRQVEVELIDPPELTDNLRLVAERKAKLADAERKLRQTAVKLSLYYRDSYGLPLIPTATQLPAFPSPHELTEEQLAFDIQLALQSRPELQVLDFKRRQYEVDYAQASNGMLPAVDAVVQGKQDVGAPTSKKRDKSPFEMEASVYLDVPLQRRKARGKMNVVEGKISQLSAKRRITEDKIVIDVQQAYAALISAYQQVVQTAEAVELAEDLARRERRNFEEGMSDLLKVTLREQYAAESATKRIDAMQLYFQSQADYRAALAQDRLP